MRRVILFAVVLVALSVCASSVLPSTAAQAPIPAEYQQLYSVLQGTLDGYNAFLATMAKLTGFTEFRSPAQFAAYIGFILDGLPRGDTKIGAGVGTWGNLAYAQILANSTTLDFIDTHVYPRPYNK